MTTFNLKKMVAVLGLMGMSVTACVTGPTAKEIKQSEIQYDLGVNDLSVGRIKQALKYFMESHRINPDFPQVHNGLGLAYFMLGNNDKALAHFDKALTLKPEYSEVMNSKARLLIGQGRFRAAIPLLKKALEDVFLKERYLAESNLGWALFHTGEQQEGFRHVRSSIAQNEKYCVGYQYLGLMLQAQKKFTEAIKEFKQMNQLCPGYPQGNRDLGKVLLMDGDEEGGCIALKACFEKSRMTPIGQECERLFKMSCKQEKPKVPVPSGG
ncbi:MAG: tetratricopeptide repeat protein [Deltaproteobacteria bacterium]|nr:tetratricopeptide repeat protein [Deltaproteobacteria bacterium]